MSSEPALVSEGRRICEEADGQGIEVRLLGGIAVWLRSDDGVRAQLGREYGDIDLVTLRKHSKPLRELLESFGYQPNTMFNAVQSDRLYYSAADGSYHLDIFVDKFAMSHKLDLAPRLGTEPVVMPAAELLLTKLQIAELNEKDARDTAMLLVGHELADHDGPGVLNVAYVAEVCAQDWGFYTTLTDNLEKVRSLLEGILPNAQQRQVVAERAAALLEITWLAPAREDRPADALVRGSGRGGEVGRASAARTGGELPDLSHLSGPRCL
jgi:hypothetical protein